MPEFKFDDPIWEQLISSKIPAWHKIDPNNLHLISDLRFGITEKLSSLNRFVEFCQNRQRQWHQSENPIFFTHAINTMECLKFIKVNKRYVQYAFWIDVLRRENRIKELTKLLRDNRDHETTIRYHHGQNAVSMVYHRWFVPSNQNPFQPLNESQNVFRLRQGQGAYWDAVADQQKQLVRDYKGTAFHLTQGMIRDPDEFYSHLLRLSNNVEEGINYLFSLNDTNPEKEKLLIGFAQSHYHDSQLPCLEGHLSQSVTWLATTLSCRQPTEGTIHNLFEIVRNNLDKLGNIPGILCFFEKYINQEFVFGIEHCTTADHREVPKGYQFRLTPDTVNTLVIPLVGMLNADDYPENPFQLPIGVGFSLENKQTMSLHPLPESRPMLASASSSSSIAPSGPSAAIASRPIPSWQPDVQSDSCTSCKKRFSVFVRRHHCRICGQIFCDAHARVHSLQQSPSSPMLNKRCCDACLTAGSYSDFIHRPRHT